MGELQEEKTEKGKGKKVIKPEPVPAGAVAAAGCECFNPIPLPPQLLAQKAVEEILEQVQPLQHDAADHEPESDLFAGLGTTPDPDDEERGTCGDAPQPATEKPVLVLTPCDESEETSPDQDPYSDANCQCSFHVGLRQVRAGDVVELKMDEDFLGRLRMMGNVARDAHALIAPRAKMLSELTELLTAMKDWHLAYGALPSGVEDGISDPEPDSIQDMVRRNHEQAKTASRQVLAQMLLMLDLHADSLRLLVEDGLKLWEEAWTPINGIKNMFADCHRALDDVQALRVGLQQGVNKKEQEE